MNILLLKFELGSGDLKRRPYSKSFQLIGRR
jgi:hypothetical protein